MRKFSKNGKCGIWIAAAAVFLCSLGAGVAETEAADTDEFSKAADHLVTVWKDYLRTKEGMYASQRWASGYAEAYLDSGDWQDLVKARSACIASARYLEDLCMAEDNLTAEEYAALALGGVDAAYQSEEFQSLTGDIETAHTFVRGTLLEHLEEGVFFENDMDVLKEELACKKDEIMLTSRYDCLTTNYLFLQLGEKEQWDSLTEDYPVLFGEASEWIDEEEDVSEAAEDVFAEMDSLTYRMDGIEAILDAAEYDQEQIEQSGDLDLLRSQLHEMTNVPDLLPVPVWYNSQPDVSGYISYYRTEDGEMIYPQSGDNLDEIPYETYGVYMQVKDVSREDLVSYLETAGEAAELVRQEEDNEWLIKMPDYAVNMEWENNTVTITFLREDITFAPSWYIALSE